MIADNAAMPRKLWHLSRVTLLAALAAGAANAAPLLLDCSKDSPAPATREIREASPLRVQLATGSPRAWLEVDEDGRALRLDAPSATLASPPRIARHGLWLSPEGNGIEISDPATPHASLRFRTRLYCADSAKRSAAMESLGAVSAMIAPGEIDAARLPALLAQLAAATLDDAADLRAYATHLAAQATLVAGKSADAAERFRQAEEAWNTVGADGARALAARAGWTEELYSLGRYDDIITATVEVAGGAVGSGATAYYRTRLLNTRCVALKYRARYDEALQCYAALTRSLKQIAEPLDLANALFNLGSLQRDLGQLAAAGESAETASKVGGSPEIQRMPVVDVAGARGRIRLLLADLALRRGAIAVAIEEYDAALADFDNAKAPRWRASTLLQLAALYGRLGVYGDAYAMWARGVSLYHFHEAPARIANALLNLANIQRDDGNARYAAWLAGVAAQQYATLRMPAEQQSAQLTQVRALVDAGDTEAAAQQLADLPERPTASRELAASAVALAQGRPELALAALDRLPNAASLAEQLDQETQRASAWHAQGDSERAIAHADAALTRLEKATAASANILLRQLLLQRGAPLRRRVLSWRLQQQDRYPDLDQLLHLLPYQPRPALLPSKSNLGPRDAFDESIARELLLGQSNATPNPTLPALLAQANAAQPEPAPSLSLTRLQAQLPSDAALFALLDGTNRSATLWITATTAQLTQLPLPASLRNQAQRLTDDLADPSTPMHRIAQHARMLREGLWPGRLPSGIRRIFVVAGAITEDIPWSLLPDDSGVALVESIDVSLVYLTPPDETPPAARLTLAVASQRSTGTPQLEPLDAADNEPRLIAAAYRRLPIDTLDAAAGPIKAALITALSRPETFVHISAHGMTDSGYLGRSGLWLDAASRGGLPQFLSVLDLFDQGVRAQLIVLNACDLGGTQNRRANTLVFADTLARLGARHVVAALWPISDNAAGLWVPAFYASLDSSPRLDPAGALRQGQLKLVRSRAFRHPFYWASLIHIHRLGVASTAPTPGYEHERADSFVSGAGADMRQLDSGHARSVGALWRRHGADFRR